MECRPANASCCQTVSIVTGYNGWWSHLADIVHTFATNVMFTHGKSFQHNMYVPVHTVRMESACSISANLTLICYFSLRS